MPPLEVAVFGASGFVGRHVVAKLAAEGHRVRAVARRGAPAATGVVSLSLDVARADVARIAEAVRGCGAVVNLVGIKRESGAQTFQNVHVAFVERLVQAMQGEGVKRLVHVSVVAARPDARSGYHDTKWQAEQCIAKAGLDATILRPGVIYGEGDDLLAHLTKMIRASPVFPIAGRGLTEQQPVDVADVADAVAACLRAPATVGKTYPIVGPEPLTLREIVGRVARALELGTRIVSTPIALMRPAVFVMNRVMQNPLSTPAQLQMLVDGMTGDPGPMRRELGVDPLPFTVDRIRSPAKACRDRLPFDVRLARRGPGEQKGSSSALVVLSLAGIVVMNAAFLVPSSDAWTRLVSGIALLGAVALPAVWRERRRLFRTDAVGVVVGLATGLALYGVASAMSTIPAFAAQIAEVSAWRKGHSVGFVVVTLVVAVVAEELFWRGEITRRLGERAPKWIAALAATAIFSVAHVASGTWLLPVAAAGIVLTWNLLFLVTGSLVAPLASHLVFDLLAMVVAPLG
jgi:NADH dehydrogenase